MGSGLKHKPFSLVLLGDVMLGRFIDDGLELEPESRPDAMFADWIELCDVPNAVVAANLECALTTEGEEANKLYTFKVKPKNAACLKKLKLDVVSLANNHCLDYGQTGLAWTIKSLESMDIAWTGAGPDAASAAKPAVVARNGLRIAFVSLSDQYEWWAAKDKVPGINFVDPLLPSSVEQAVEQVRSARQGPRPAHIVVVMCHWGPNWRWQPDDDVRALGRALADAGADVVIGTGPHHLQGVEMGGPSGRTPIIYSAGKFMDDFKVDGEFRNDIGCVWVVRVEGGHAVSIQGLPCHIKQETRSGPPPSKPPGGGAPPYFTRVVRAGSTESGWAVRRLAALSRDLGTELVVDESSQSVSLQVPLPPPPPDQTPSEEVQAASGGPGGS